MNELKKILLVKDIHPLAFRKIGKAIIIEDKKEIFVIKLNTNNSDIYKYLISRKFEAFPQVFSAKDDEYEITLFIPDLSMNNDQKVNDLLFLLADLHQKTSYSKTLVCIY